MPISSKQSGFTLIEMMIVIAIIGILTGIAVPNYIAWLPKSRLNGTAREIFVTMSLTRMQAISRNTVGIIKFDPANNTFTAWLDDGPAGNNWALDSTDTPIKNGSTNPGVSISNTTIPFHTYGYNSRGLFAGTAYGGEYEVTLTNLSGETRRVQINTNGRIKILQL